MQRTCQKSAWFNQFHLYQDGERSDLEDWDEMAPYVTFATFAYNNAKPTSTKFTSFYLMYMREACISLDLMLHRT